LPVRNRNRNGHHNDRRYRIHVNLRESQLKLKYESETKNSSFEYSCTRIFKTQRPESPKSVSHKHKKSTVSASSLSESTGPDQCQKSTSKWPQTAAHNSIVSASSLSRLNKPDQSQNRPSNSHRRLRSLSDLLWMQPSKKRKLLVKLARNPLATSLRQQNCLPSPHHPPLWFF
jgi:hypothetical protein